MVLLYWNKKTSAGSSRGCQNFSAIAAHCAAGPGAPPDQQHHPTSYWSIIPIPLGPATHLSKEVIQGPVNPEVVSWVGLWIMLAVDADPGKVGHGVKGLEQRQTQGYPGSKGRSQRASSAAAGISSCHREPPFSPLVLCCPCIYLCIGEGEDEEKREEESRRLSVVEDFLINQQQCWYLHDGGAECPAQGQSPMVQSSVLKSLQLKMKQKVTCEESKQMGRAGASEEINSNNSLSVFVPLSRRFQNHLKLRQESPSLGCNNGWTYGIKTMFSRRSASSSSASKDPF